MARVALVYAVVELLSLFEHENLVERFATGIAEATRQISKISPTTSLPEMSFNHADAWWHNTKCFALVTFTILGLMTMTTSMSVVFLGRLRSKSAWLSLLFSLLLTCLFLCFSTLFYLWNYSAIDSLCLPYHTNLDYAFEKIQRFDLTAREMMTMLRVCSEEDNLAIALVKTSQVYGHAMQYAGLEVDPKTESVLYHAPFGTVKLKPLQGLMEPEVGAVAKAHIKKDLKCHIGGALCMNVMQEACEDIGSSFKWIFWSNLVCLLATLLASLLLF
jgi:hypothetical protein